MQCNHSSTDYPSVTLRLWLSVDFTCDHLYVSEIRKANHTFESHGRHQQRQTFAGLLGSRQRNSPGRNDQEASQPAPHALDATHISFDLQLI